MKNFPWVMAVWLGVSLPVGADTPLWTDAERAACVAFWNTPGRTVTTLTPARAALTPEASLWFSAFHRALRTASPDDTVAWNTWVDAKLAHDRLDAAQLAGTALPSPPPPAGTASPAPTSVPGVIPASLLLAAGDPPPLAAAVIPKQYTIDLGGDDGPPLTYSAPIAASPRSRSYRFEQGVISVGQPLKEMSIADVNGLMQSAGLTPFEAHVIGAVSRLEGGFDAVNTYDTGYVSVGFIQFITASDGSGSLATVLATEKASQPGDFARDFHSRGIDVTPDGIFAVVDPSTGAALTGADAVRKTVADPRLMAVFQAAGRRSLAFRIAQIQIAKRGYYPANDLISITLANNTVLTGRVGDILQSEAGMATAFDRKVNTGHAAPEVSAAATTVMTAHHLTQLSQIAPYEREVVAALKYRTDFLADPTLLQPH